MIKFGSNVMAAFLTWVVGVQFPLEYGNVNPHRADRFDSEIQSYNNEK